MNQRQKLREGLKFGFECLIKLGMRYVDGSMRVGWCSSSVGRQAMKGESTISDVA